MKIHYQNKRIIKLTEELMVKNEHLEMCTNVLLQFIKDKATLSDIENQTTKRNLLFIDISNIEKQILNLQRNKNQYGVEFQERNVSQWIGDY